MLYEVITELLSLDFGREKTAYFMGKDVKNAVSDNTVAGVFIGRNNFV